MSRSMSKGLWHSSPWLLPIPCLFWLSRWTQLLHCLNMNFHCSSWLGSGVWVGCLQDAFLRALGHTFLPFVNFPKHLGPLPVPCSSFSFSVSAQTILSLKVFFGHLSWLPDICKELFPLLPAFTKFLSIHSYISVHVAPSLRACCLLISIRFFL